MSKRDNTRDRRVDAFVQAVNSSPRESLRRDDIPDACRLSEGESPGFFDWRIVPSHGADWLPEVESHLPFHLPSTFRSLIARYLFPAFEVGPLTLYSVGVNDSHRAGMEFRSAIFADGYMGPFLFKNRFLPFARPADSSYDPVCFDYRNSSGKVEHPIIRIDHEEILCHDRIRVIETLSRSFDSLIEEITRQLRK
jgi:hypothetical protein